jgi:transcription-repair coupling factor (superfamily II helicase)
VRLRADLEDAFGPVPEPVVRLLELAEIRVLAGAFGIVSISRQPPDLVFSIDSVAAVDSLFADAPGSVRIPDERTIHLRLAPAYFEQPTLLAVLRQLLGRARVDVGTKT